MVSQTPIYDIKENVPIMTQIASALTLYRGPAQHHASHVRAPARTKILTGTASVSAGAYIALSMIAAPFGAALPIVTGLFVALLCCAEHR